MATTTHGILGFTPEGSEPLDENVSGFEFQDDEDDVEAEFERHRLFALDLADSAADPGEPGVAHGQHGVADFSVDTFTDSYGDPQPVEVTRQARAGERPDALPRQRRQGPADPDQGGPGRRALQQRPGRGLSPPPRRGEGHRARRRGRGLVRGRGRSTPATSRTRPARRPGDKVLDPLARRTTPAGVPAQDPDGPHYLSYYRDALDAVGIAYDVYDVDDRDNRSPDRLGVLSHYDAVIWYTGDDELTRQPGQGPAPAVRASRVEEMIDVRDYLNEGGKLLFTGKEAGAAVRERGRSSATSGSRSRRDTAAGGEYCNKNGTDMDPETEAFESGPSSTRTTRRRPTDASRTTTTSSSTTWGRTSAPRRATPLDESDRLSDAVAARRHRGRPVRGAHLRLRRDRRRATRTRRRPSW